jgi:hypothetical protein
VPSADAFRRLRPYAIGLLVGVGALVAAWIAFGGDDSLSADPGIPPPEYVYLDNGRVLAYLSQIEGGLTSSEKVSEQLTRSRSGGISASGVQVGGSVSQEQFVERVVTPTATTRFYRLLDRLGAKSYLHTVDVAGGLREAARELRSVPEGDFVRIRNCRVYVPTYAKMDLLIRAAREPLSAEAAEQIAISGTVESIEARLRAENATTHPGTAIVGMPNIAQAGGEQRKRLLRASARFAAGVGANPRVAISSCSGEAVSRPRGLDLLFPISLGSLNNDPSVLDGPVTVVGKLLRSVDRQSVAYVDTAALASWSRPVEGVDEALAELDPDREDLAGELSSDVTVLDPGVVVLPIAVYK